MQKVRIKKLNLSMRMRMLCGFAGVLFIFLATAMFNLNQVAQIKGQMSAQNGKTDLQLKALELKELVQEMNIIASGLEISKNTEYIDRYNATRKTYNDMVKTIGDTAATDEQRRWRSQLIIASNDYIANFDTAARLIQDKSVKPADLDNNMVYLYGESVKLMNTIKGIADQFYAVYAKEAQSEVARTNSMLNGTTAVMMAAAGLVLLVTLAVAFLLNRSFIGPIRRLQKAVSLIAAGDLRHKIDSEATDELGQLSGGFDRMIDQVRAMVSGTQRIASSLTEHADSFHRFSLSTAAVNGDIVRSIEEMSRGADQQAVQAERSAAIISELEEEIVHIADSTGNMLAASRDAADYTERGTEAVRALQTAAGASQQVLEQVQAEMESLRASSQHIGHIVKTITEISSQTQVLALNAAIEAARAGVHGRGFSVIAEEVRKLAEETNQSSKSITEIISSLQRQIGELLSSMGSARKATDEQNAKVKDTFAAFETIALSMEHLSEQIEHIHGKIDVVKDRNATLVAAVQQVAAIAEETAAGSEEVGSTSAEQDASIRRIADESDDIRMLAGQLFSEISKFQIGEYSGDGRDGERDGGHDGGIDGVHVNATNADPMDAFGGAPGIGEAGGSAAIVLESGGKNTNAAKVMAEKRLVGASK